jgi:glycosyltransferase involved in cell wall biosynthesis
MQTWLPQMDVFGGLAALATGTPWVLSERASGAAYAERWKDRALRRGVGRRATGVVANSAAGAAYWANAAPAVPRYVVPNAVALAEIAAATTLDPATLGFEAAAPYVVFAGRLAPQKNLPWLIAALRQVFASHPGTALIAGEGPDRAALEAQVRALGLGDRVRFLGYRDDPWALMKATAVLVNPSRFEGQPNAVVEAMACGLPVVVSDIPEHRELLAGDLGTLVPSDDVAGLAAAITCALDAGPGIQVRARRARAHVAALTPERAAERYEEIYSALAASSTTVHPPRPFRAATE